MPTKSEIAVYVETGAKRVFASAVDWPGLSRGAKDERAALQALASYGSRYAAVVGHAVKGVAVPPRGMSRITPGRSRTAYLVNFAAGRA